MMKKIIFSLFILCAICSFAQDTTQQIMPGRQNATHQQDKPYVILISADGFRNDFATKYNAKNLLALGKQGGS
jgi:predicted AlkP superfamily pyrophosphatase or phosphodiesterase